MDERSNKAVSGDFTAKPQREKRLTDELNEEKTQVVWKVRTGASGKRSGSKSLIPLVATVTVVVASLAITLALLLMRTRDPAAGSLNSEDPLALYQVATELYDQGEHRAALQMVRRAREVTQHARAHKQLDELERAIEGAIAGGGQGKVGEQAGGLPPQNEAAGQRSAPTRSERGGEGTGGGASGARQAPAKRAANGRVAAESLVYVESDAIGDVLVDGRPTGARTPATLTLEPGRHTIEVVPLIDPSERMVKDVIVKRGVATRVQLSLAAESAPAERTASSGAGTSPGSDSSSPHGAGGPPKGAASSERGPKPAIGTVGARKPAIGLVGGSEPTIGIIKTE